MGSFPELPLNRKLQIILLFQNIPVVKPFWLTRCPFYSFYATTNDLCTCKWRLRLTVKKFQGISNLTISASYLLKNLETGKPVPSHNTVSLDITIPSNLLTSESILKFIWSNIYCNLWNNFNLKAVSRKKLRNLTVSRQNWKNVTVNRQSSPPPFFETLLWCLLCGWSRIRSPDLASNPSFFSLFV